MESSKKKKFCFKKFASFNYETKRFTCLIETCKKEISGASTGNLKRHYKLVHNMVIDKEETPPKPIVKIKLNTASDREEILECNESKKRRRFCFNKFASYNYETKRYTCLVENCKKELSAVSVGNLKRHYRLVHNTIIDELQPLPKTIVTKNTRTKLKIALKREELLKRKASSKRRRFCFNKFASYNYEKKRFICLVETCKKELSASVGNLKRHYRLVHNMIIDGQQTLPRGIVTNNPRTKLNIALNREEFLKCCIGLVTKNNMPFEIFDDTAFFKKIIEPYEETFEVTLNSKNISNILGDSSHEIKRAIAKMIENKMICLKIDVASRQDECILGINIQYICDFKICTYTIGMIPSNKIHTAQYLKEEIMKCLEEYNIDIKQIYSNTIDNGGNVALNLKQELQDDDLKMAEETVYVYDNTTTYDAIESQLSSVFSVVRCAAHTIQLVAYDVIRTLETEINDVRIIAKQIRTVLSTENQDIILPCLDDTIKWSSTYDMVTSILSLKETINELENSINISVNWKFLESFATAFKPLFECTMHMQSEQYIIGDFYRDWMECELDLQDMIETNSYAEALYRAMVIRKRTLLEYEAFVAALYLDPRFNFKGTPLLTGEQKQTALDHLIKTYEIISQVSHSSSTQDEKDIILLNESSTSLDSSLNTSNTARSKLAQHINQHLNTSRLTAKNDNFQIKTELMAICERQMEPLEINVLQYWQQISANNSKLSRLAEVVLALPATQMTLERAFDALSIAFTNLNSKISNKSLSDISITKCNFNLLNCSAIKLENLE